MLNIPINAKVTCTDGACGRSIAVIINPVQDAITHVVVKEEGLLDRKERLVPLAQVEKTGAGEIFLQCDRATFSEFRPFARRHFVQGERTEYAPVNYVIPYAVRVQEPAHKVVEVETVPSGTLAVHRGAEVAAQDGPVGRVDEFVVEENGDITHLMVREGPLWEPGEIAIPVSAIERIEQETVHLALNQEQVAALPDVPIRRMYDVQHVELLMWFFPEHHERASAALVELKRRHRAGEFVLLNAAVLAKGEDLAVTIEETEDLDAAQGALFGAISGALVGLWGGPVGALVGAVAGSVTGGVAAHLIDMGFSDEELQDLQAALPAGGSALVALVEYVWVERVIEALADFDARVNHLALSDAMVQSYQR